MPAAVRGPSRAMPAAVLFDMDGTLVDTEPIWFDAEREIMTAYGGVWGETDQQACLGGPVTHTVEYMALRLPDPPGVCVLTTELLDAVERRIRSTQVRWQPGARELLAEAHEHGLPTALVSASWGRIITAVTEQISLSTRSPAFDVIVSGDDVTRTKPHPEPYRAAARALGLAPADCLAIEDSATGIASAVAAGCRVIAVPVAADSPAVPVAADSPAVPRVASLTGARIGDLWRLVTADVA